jgi:hypothetical protein
VFVCSTNRFPRVLQLWSLASNDSRVSVTLTRSVLAPNERVEIGTAAFDAAQCAAHDNYMSVLTQWTPPNAAAAASVAGGVGAVKGAGRLGAVLDESDREARVLSQRIWKRLSNRGALHVNAAITVPRTGL